MVYSAARWFSRLPDRDLYHLPPPFSWLMRLIQLGSLAMAVAGAKAVGPLRITGLEQFRDLLNGLYPEREPEAQGPCPDTNSQMKVEGPFRFTRHPLNLAAAGVFCFFPHMTVNRATLAALSTLYLALGSLHEEIRLHVTYGKQYETYQHSKVPFFIPTVGTLTEYVSDAVRQIGSSKSVQHVTDQVEKVTGRS